MSNMESSHRKATDPKIMTGGGTVLYSSMSSGMKIKIVCKQVT